MSRLIAFIYKSTIHCCHASPSSALLSLVFVKMRARVAGVAGALLQLLLLSVSRAEFVDPKVLDSCPGYDATNVKSAGPSLTADLVLAGEACNVFGNDTRQLQLEVTYETGKPHPAG